MRVLRLRLARPEDFSRLVFRLEQRTLSKDCVTQNHPFVIYERNLMNLQIFCSIFNAFKSVCAQFALIKIARFSILIKFILCLLNAFLLKTSVRTHCFKAGCWIKSNSIILIL